MKVSKIVVSFLTDNYQLPIHVLENGEVFYPHYFPDGNGGFDISYKKSPDFTAEVKYGWNGCYGYNIELFYKNESIILTQVGA